jgi:hypothetical protein
MNNDVLHILSHDGSLEFKNEVENAELMVRNPMSDVPNLDMVHNELSEKITLLESEVDNPAYSDHQKVVMKTYIDKLDDVIGLIQDRVNYLINSGEYVNARGFRRRSVRRRSVRRRTGRRRTGRRRTGRRRTVRRRTVRRTGRRRTGRRKH